MGNSNFDLVLNLPTPSFGNLVHQIWSFIPFKGIRLKQENSKYKNGNLLRGVAVHGGRIRGRRGCEGKDEDRGRIRLGNRGEEGPTGKLWNRRGEMIGSLGVRR